MLKPFCQLLARSFPLRWPLAKLPRELGPEALQWLQRFLGVRQVGLRVGGCYPCSQPRRPGCVKRLIRGEGGALRVVCGLASPRCREELLQPPNTFQIVLDARDLVPHLQQALQLRQQAAPAPDAIALGEKYIEGKVFSFLLALNPSSESLLAWLQMLQNAEPERFFVVLYFDDEGMLAQPLRSPRLEWISLARSRATSEGLSIDLTPALERFAPEALRKADCPLVADPQQRTFWYGGQRLKLTETQRRLLTLLLGQPGVLLSRQYLLPRMYPASYATRDAVDTAGQETALRKAKHGLRKAFAALEHHDLPEGVPANPIDGERSTEDTQGTYRICLRPDQILWQSAPPSDLTDPVGPLPRT